MKLIAKYLMCLTAIVTLAGSSVSIAGGCCNKKATRAVHWCDAENCPHAKAKGVEACKECYQQEEQQAEEQADESGGQDVDVIDELQPQGVNHRNGRRHRRRHGRNHHHHEISDAAAAGIVVGATAGIAAAVAVET